MEMRTDFPSLYQEFRDYGNEAIKRSAMTHADYTAELVSLPSRYTTWHEGGGKDRKGVVIPQALILNYYKGLAAKNG